MARHPVSGRLPCPDIGPARTWRRETRCGPGTPLYRPPPERQTGAGYNGGGMTASTTAGRPLVYKSRMRIEGATAVLTGATGGLGAAIARALHERGARLVLSGRQQSRLASLGAELDAAVFPCDLADRSASAQLAQRAASADIVVANAALPAAGMLEEFSIEEIDRVIDVNLRAPIVLARAAVPAMRERGHGHIVFVASMSAKVVTPRTPLYTASKFGLRGFALGLRQDLSGSGVGVSLVHPGPIADAGMWVEAGVEPPRSAGPRRAADVAAGVVGAIEGDVAEVHVASRMSRVAVLLGELAPDRFASMLARSGSAEVAEQMAAGLRHRR